MIWMLLCSKSLFLWNCTWHVIVRTLWPFDFCQAIVIVASPETIQLLESLSYTFQVHSQQEKIGPFSDKRSVGVQLQCITYCHVLASSIHFGSLQHLLMPLMNDWNKKPTFPSSVVRQYAETLKAVTRTYSTLEPCILRLPDRSSILLWPNSWTPSNHSLPLKCVNH